MRGFGNAPALVLVLLSSGCAGEIPTAPDVVASVRSGASSQRVVSYAQVSGQVYAVGPVGEPSIESPVIQARAADGAVFEGLAVGDGYYRVSAPLGWVSITASEDGYASSSAEFLLTTDTVLNFGLRPLQ